MQRGDDGFCGWCNQSNLMHAIHKVLQSPMDSVALEELANAYNEAFDEAEAHGGVYLDRIKIDETVRPK